MPLIERAIEPITVSRGTVAAGIQNELECVTNYTLSRLIQQLSSLSKHSEDLFGELHQEACRVMIRTQNIHDRVERLKQKITQLNPTVEEVSLQEINLRKPFRGYVGKEQQIMVLSTRSFAISEKYNQCEAPPALNKLDSYREDGKDSLKFYTDPGYFVELWCMEMLAADKHAKRPKQRHKDARVSKEPKTIRLPKNRLEDFKDLRHGPEFVEKLRQEHDPDLSVSDSGISSRSASSAGINRQYSSQASVSNQVQGHRHTEYGYIFQNGPSNDRPAGDPVQANTGAKSSRRNDTRSEYRPGYRDSEVPENKSGDSRPTSTSSSQIASPRPSVPPPAPPGATKQRPVNHSSSINRQSLPSPPPMPLQINSNSQDVMSELLNRQTHSPKLTSNAYRFDLPPPPTPPPVSSPYDSIPSPIPPPPPMDGINDFQIQSLPPPPPLPPALLENNVAERNGSDWTNESNNNAADGKYFLTVQPDTVSLTSDISSTTASSSKPEDVDVPKSAEKPLVIDTRSDLLSAIREGIQLRKVEERRLKTEQKQQKSGQLDVQSIMEAAFELRRKQLEENDSDRDGDDDVDNWSDD